MRHLFCMNTIRWAFAGVSLPAVALWLCQAVMAKEPDTTERVKPLPALAQAASWTVQPEQGALTLTQAENGIGVFFDCREGNAGAVLLKTPLPIPEWATGFTFLGIKDIPQLTQLYFNLLVKDSAGNEYIFYTDSPSTIMDQGGLYFGTKISAWSLLGEVRFTVPAFRAPSANPPNYAPVIPKTPAPQAPYTLRGISLKGNDCWGNYPGTTIYLHDFAFTRQETPQAQVKYWFNLLGRDGLLDPNPYLTLGDFNRSGHKFWVTWELRDQYAGQPVAAGGKTYDLGDSKGLAHLVGLSQRIDLPLPTPGTYWVRVRARWAERPDAAVPDGLDEKDYRLVVVRSTPEAATPATPIQATEPVANALVRIGTASKSGTYVYGEKEPLVVPVAFFPPPAGLDKVAGKITVTPFSSDEVAKEMDVTPAWTGNAPDIVDLDLKNLPSGIYRVTATMSAGLKVLDQATRVVARQGPSPEVLARDLKIPDSVPSWQEQVRRTEPLYQLTFNFPDDDPVKRWQLFQAMVDHLPAKFRSLELIVPWRLLEPLPGVYDFDFCKRILDHAQQKGIKVSFWFDYEGGGIPDWVPSLYAQDASGEIFGNWLYGSHGGRINYIAAPIRERLLAFLGNFVASLRPYPALIGYFWLDESYARTPGGYDPETQAEFRQYCRETWKTLAALNARWQTRFTAWDQVAAPRKREEVSLAHWVDWRRFYYLRLPAFHKQVVETIRRYDPKRLVFIEGFPYLDEMQVWLRDHGCATANGGAHDPMELGPRMMWNAGNHLQERSESVSLLWTDTPYRLDGTVFTASLAGGDNIIGIRSYVARPAKDDFSAWFKPQVGLDRVEKFMPILQELRQTEALPRDAFLYTGAWACNLQGHVRPATPGVWDMFTLAEGHVTCGVAPWSLAEQGKMLFAMSDMQAVGPETVDRLVSYVRAGGTLVMTADTGRRCWTLPEEDWVLLRRFGFRCPEDDRMSYYARAFPVPGEVFPPEAKPFELYAYAQTVPQPDAKAAACFNNDAKRPAVSWKASGKGKVVVIWGQSVVPVEVSRSGNRQSYPVMRDLARWGGVRLDVDATTPRFWVNLLKAKRGDAYYALVMRYDSWYDKEPAELPGATTLPGIPDGEYRVSERITGNDLGSFSSTHLRTQGIAVTLAPLQVAILRLAPANSASPGDQDHDGERR